MTEQIESACVRPISDRAAMTLSSSASSALASSHSLRKFGSFNDSFSISRQVLVSFISRSIIRDRVPLLCMVIENINCQGKGLQTHSSQSVPSRRLTAPSPVRLRASAAPSRWKSPLRTAKSRLSKPIRRAKRKATDAGLGRRWQTAFFRKDRPTSTASRAQPSPRAPSGPLPRMRSARQVFRTAPGRSFV